MARNTVIYLSPYDILRPRTNQVSDVRFVEGFAQNNCDAYLLVPFVKREDNIPKEEVRFAYGLETPIHIEYLPTRFTRDVHGSAQLARVAWYATLKTLEIIRRRKHAGKIYVISRSTHLLHPFFYLRAVMPWLFRKVSLIHWAHDFHTRNVYKRIYRWSDFLLATNSSILNSMLSKTRRPEKEGAITYNPITEAQAKEKISREQARMEAGLEKISTPLVVYTGKLGLNYDLEIKKILEAAAQLKEYTFLLTGGKPEAVAYWSDYCHGKGTLNVIFTGYIHDYRRIRYYQYAADVLVSFYTHQAHDVRYNLPNKICEYMLTGNPIVSPDYPATRDLLRSDNCIFTKPEDSRDLAKHIREAIEYRSVAMEKAERAAREVREITFRKVTAKLLRQFP